MQNQAYARKMKISNLQQMAKTIIYVQENGFNTQEDLKTKLSSENTKLAETQEKLSILTTELKTVNEQIHFTGQYQQHKRIYSDFLKSNNKKKFRQDHSAEVTAYEEARRWIKDHLANETIESIASLKNRKSHLQEQIQKQKQAFQAQKNICHDLEIANTNVSGILDMKYRVNSYEHQL